MELLIWTGTGRLSIFKELSHNTRPADDYMLVAMKLQIMGAHHVPEVEQSYGGESEEYWILGSTYSNKHIVIRLPRPLLPRTIVSMSTDNEYVMLNLPSLRFQRSYNLPATVGLGRSSPFGRMFSDIFTSKKLQKACVNSSLHYSLGRYQSM